MKIKLDKLDIIYIYPINLFLISIPLIYKEREIIRFFPIFYFLFLFLIKKIKISKEKILFYLIVNIYIIVLLMLFRNKDLLTYIYIFLLNIFLTEFDKNIFLDKLINSIVILITLYLISYVTGILTIDFTEYRNRLYFLYSNRETIMGAPFWGNIFYSLTVLIILRYENIKSIILGIILQLICFKFLDTRGPLLCSFIFLCLFIMKNRIKKKYIYYLLNCMFIFYLIVSILFPIYFKSNEFFNKITSNRVIYWSEFLKERGIEGIIKISSVKALDFRGDIIVDNSYLHLIFNSGIYITFFLIAFFLIAFKNLEKKNETKEMIFLISFLTYCFLESILFRYEVFATMYFWYLIIKNIKISKEKNEKTFGLD